MSTIKILYWPDGTWVEKDDFKEAEWGWKGDDYGTLEVPSSSDEDDINRLVNETVYEPFADLCSSENVQQVSRVLTDKEVQALSHSPNLINRNRLIRHVEYVVLERSKVN